MSIEFHPSGDTALVVQFGDRIDRALSARVLRVRERIRAARLPGVTETVASFRSILVHYDPLAVGAAELRRRIEAVIEEAQERARPVRTWKVPVCYAPAFAPDLAEVSARTGLTPEQIAECHSSVAYHVYMLGFLPGYPYMGDVPAELVLPRREDPRIRVPPGAVGIATEMTAIYTLESPAGWHLIGTTPVRIFDVRWRPPALFAPGDRVIFVPVSPAEFEKIRAASRAGRYAIACEEAAA